MMNLIDDFSFYTRPDFHSVYSIQLCELIEGGWIDFSDESWDFDSYQREGVENDREQRDRFWLKFMKRYYWREIGIIPPGQWKWEVLRKLNEIMPKYVKMDKCKPSCNKDYEEYNCGCNYTNKKANEKTMICGILI